MSSLQGITGKLNTQYAAWKQKEKNKNSEKEEFFQLADEALAKETLAQKTIDVPSEDNVDDYIDSHYPEWTIVKVEELSVLIEEDPRLKPFAYVNKRLGKVFSRSIKKGQVELDDERLKSDNPTLWEEVTEEVRVPLPEDKLTPEQLAKLAPYLSRGKPSRVLNAPRKATEEEMGWERN